VRDIIDPGAPTRSLALLDLPPRAASEERMVGDVTDRGAALLVAGVVEDASGKPLQGAAVEVREVRQRGQSRVADTDDVTTDAEGRFSVEGATGESKLTVHVSLEGWYLAELPMFAPGRDDLRVTLAPAGGIAGSVRTPEGAAPLRVEIFVSGEPSRNGGTGYEASDGLSTWVQKDGSFSFPSLRPGKAKVSVRHGWSDRDTVAVVEDVEVVAGQVTRDPRLQGLDLAKSLRAIRVSAVDPDGRPVAGATAHWRATGEDTYWREVTSGKDGVATIHVKPRDGRPARIDVIVKRSGHRSAALSGIETDVQATLRPWKPVLVRIRLADATAVPEPPFHIVPELAWTEPGAEKEDDDWADMDPRGVDDDVSFGKDRVVTLSVPEPGRYRVTLVLWETGPGGGGGSSLATSPERVVVDVPEHASGPIEVVVAADPEEFAEETKRRTER
jgi:hypothetical protein